MAFKPIVVRLCEPHDQDCPPQELVPLDCESPERFKVDSYFDLRKAVVPVFWMYKDGHLEGLGSAFSLDPWGKFISADHLVAKERDKAVRRKTGNNQYKVKMPDDEGLVVLLGMGAIYGTPIVPPNAMPRVASLWANALEKDDPMAALQGKVELCPIDLTVMATKGANLDLIRNLPFRSRPPCPMVGEQVVALGFPEIEAFEGSVIEARTTISEQMYAAYGTVKSLLRDGRDDTNLTPVFEVQANWSSGMSGGPVLNSNGEVIGIVSRSLGPGDGQPGTGWATMLGGLPDFSTFAPTLDSDNVDF
ncbi:MAG: trypsin-like peptidase domain-containing protein [Chloroflexi bacterium]|nr:trypsin-like peptidase domain-containing protein [Chloroflexota bacterium]